jgi:hypothetical protein
VRFATDPKFVDLGVAGASEPLAINLAPFGTAHIGEVPVGASLNSARGRRSGSAENVVIVGRNGTPLGFVVDWVNKHCVLDGSFLGGTGGVVADDGQTYDLQLLVTAGGTLDSDPVYKSLLVNQPPRPNAGVDQTIECTSPAGASVNLSGTGSTDADGNIAYYVWRRDADTGPHVGSPSVSPAIATTQALGETNYYVRVVDSRFAADSDSVKVTVVDTTPAEVTCNAPATISPTDAPISFKATASDLCGASSAVIQSFACFEVKKDGRVLDRREWCKVAIEGDTLTILNPGGVNTTIQWQAGSTDAAGNASLETCEVFVANP